MAKCPLFVAANKEKDECIKEQCAWFKQSSATSRHPQTGERIINGECVIMKLSALVKG